MAIITEYSSPGAYSIGNETPFDESRYILLTNIIPPSGSTDVYKWKIVGIDKYWRESWQGKKLERDYYTIQYSNDESTILGSYTTYLNEDKTIVISAGSL